MPALIDRLLTEPDAVEVVRDQIAAILTVELAHQATLGGPESPRVFTERTNPWGPLVEEPPRLTPIVNVWFDTGSFEGAASNIVSRQRCDGTFNVDVYALAPSREEGAGHAPGDEAAARECQATMRRVRQILMSAPYTYLGLRGLVWKRWPQTLTMFHPSLDERLAINVIAERLALVVQFNELAPDVEGQPLETLSVEVFRATTGELLVRADYPTP